MTENPDRHFKNKEVVNFDLIHHKCRGDPLKNTYKEYKTVKESNFENYLKKDEKKSCLQFFAIKETIYGCRRNIWLNILGKILNDLLYFKKIFNQIIVNNFWHDFYVINLFKITFSSKKIMLKFKEV